MRTWLSECGIPCNEKKHTLEEARLGADIAKTGGQDLLEDHRRWKDLDNQLRNKACRAASLNLKPLSNNVKEIMLGKYRENTARTRFCKS